MNSVKLFFAVAILLPLSMLTVSAQTPVPESELIIYKMQNNRDHNPLYFMEADEVYRGVRMMADSSYAAHQDSLGNLVLDYKRGGRYEYTYDTLGRITSNPGVWISYRYEDNILDITGVVRKDSSLYFKYRIEYAGKYPVRRSMVHINYEGEEVRTEEWWTYDRFGRMTGYTTLDEGSTLADSIYAVISYSGYRSHNRRNITVCYGDNQLYYNRLDRYDDAGRVIRSYIYDGYDGTECVAEYEYADSLNAAPYVRTTSIIQSSTRPANKKIREIYDSNGWLVRIEESEDGVIPFSIKKEIKIEYDDRGNVVKWFVISPRWCQCDFVEYEYY